VVGSRIIGQAFTGPGYVYIRGRLQQEAIRCCREQRSSGSHESSFADRVKGDVQNINRRIQALQSLSIW